MRWIYNCLYNIIKERLRDPWDNGELRSHWVFFNPDTAVMENEWGIDDFRPRIRLRSLSYHVHSPDYYDIGVIQYTGLERLIQMEFPLEYFKNLNHKGDFIDKCILTLGKILSKGVEEFFNKQVFGPTPVIVFAYEDGCIHRNIKNAKYDLEGLFSTELVKLAAAGEFGIETKVIVRTNLYPMKCDMMVFYENIPDSLIIE